MKQSRLKPAFASIIIAITCAMIGNADTITLKEGRVVEGKIITATKDAVEIEVARGDLKAVSFYTRNEVSRIAYGPSPADSLKKEYETRLAKTADTATDWHALGRWCSEQFLTKKAKEAYWKATELDPNHERAWRALGYVLHDGRWVTEEEAMLAKGFVRHEGRWMAPEERDRLVEIERAREEKRIAEAKERQAKIDAYWEEIRLRALNRKIARMEKNMERELNRHTYDSSCHPAFYPGYRTVYVPIIVGPRLSIHGTHEFNWGQLTFDLNL